MRSRLVFLVFALAGCSSWHPVTLPTPQEQSWIETGRLRLTVPGGGHAEGTMARVRGDSLLLVVDSGTLVAAVPLNAAPMLEQRTFSGGKSVGLVLLVGLGGLLVLGIAVGSTTSGGY